MAKKAIILGASGLIGGELLRLLLSHEDYSSVQILVRKSLNINHPKLKESLTDFKDLETLKDLLSGNENVIFSCLGSTKSKTPNQQDYRRIDLEIPFTLARYAKEKGIPSFHVVSAIGANAQSSTFYVRLKGELEEALKGLSFHDLHIYQPSLIKGDRKEKRLMEKAFIALSAVIDPLLIGSLKKYRSIEASTIATAMVNQSIKNMEGIFVYPSDKIKELA